MIRCQEAAVQFMERTYRDAFGNIVIQSRMGPAPGRLGYEKQLFPGLEVGLAGWQPAHSQGSGTGRATRVSQFRPLRS